MSADGVPDARSILIRLSVKIDAQMRVKVFCILFVHPGDELSQIDLELLVYVLSLERLSESRMCDQESMRREGKVESVETAQMLDVVQNFMIALKAREGMDVRIDQRAVMIPPEHNIDPAQDRRLVAEHVTRGRATVTEVTKVAKLDDGHVIASTFEPEAIAGLARFCAVHGLAIFAETFGDMNLAAAIAVLARLEETLLFEQSFEPVKIAVHVSDYEYVIHDYLAFAPIV